MPARSSTLRIRRLLGNGLLILAALCLAAPLSAQSGPPSHVDYDLLIEDVELRPGVLVDVHLAVFVDEGHPCVGRTAVAVPGFAHTAATFAPLAEAIFASAQPGQHPCRIVAVDFPGHGDSGLPTAIPFGFLSLDDYVTTLIEVLERLPELGLRPDTVIAHSQGALVVQLAQQRLVASASSLRESFQVKDVVLLAPVPPQQVPWAFADSGFAVGVLAGFLTADAIRGPHFALPDAVWGPIFFSNLLGAVSPLAPSAADVATQGYNAPEPLISALQLVGALHLAGLPAAPRVAIDAGIFGPGYGTSLHVVAFAHDQIVRPGEAMLVYTHLTGDTSGAGFVEVGGAFSVHDTYLSDPRALLDAIEGIIRIR